MENSTHRGDYTGTTNMNADNQDMEFVNDTLELAEDKHAVRNQEKLNSGPAEEK
ncbi:hypothetical protein [Paenibacillus lutrae]|uniref:hypothetical protein n=1 Tax=Paenibacillus lutrae TaxID=2078573 RepID=UPI0012FB406C|nr:hypothetical protein [Paenibacillus lutrae]